MAVPESLVLRPIQQAMKSHGYQNPFSALWADMGAGKTAVTLDLICDLLAYCDVAKVLVVATKRVAKNTWPKEIRRWDRFQHLSCRVIEAEDFSFKRTKVPVKKRIKGKVVTTEVTRNVPARPVAHFLTGEVIHTIHRDLFASLVTFLGDKHWPYDMVVIDESSGFRDQDSKRFKAAKVLRKHGKLGRMIQLSGTPTPKGLLNLWAQIYARKTLFPWSSQGLAKCRVSQTMS